LLSGVGLGASLAAILFLFGSFAFAFPLLAVGLLLVSLSVVLAVIIYNLRIWSAEQDACFWTGVGAGTAAVSIGLIIEGLIARAFAIQSNVLPTAVNKIKELYKDIANLLGALFGAGSLAANSTPPQECMR
jgi:hypothetical protein